MIDKAGCVCLKGWCQEYLCRRYEIGNTFTEGASVTDAYTEVIGLGGNYIGDASIECAYAESTSTKGAGTEGAGAGNTSARGAGIGDAGLRDASAAGASSIGDVGALKDLGIHLRWSRIMEMRLFSTGLETWIGAGYIESACVDRTLEVKGAGLEVRVVVGWW